MMSNKNVRGSIGRRLGLVQALVLVIALIGSAMGYLGLSRVAAQTEAMYQETIVTERVASDWYRNVYNGGTRTTAIAVSADPALATFFAEQAAESTKSSTELQARMDKLLNSPEERAAFDRVIDLRKAYIKVRDTITEAKKQGDPARAKQLFDEQFKPAAATYLESIRVIAQQQRDQLDTSLKALAETNARARTALVVFGLVALVAGGALAVWLTRSITRPLAQAAEVADAIARFDLTGRIETTGGDETGQLLRSLSEMQAALVRLIGEVRGSTDSIGTASAEIAMGNMDLSARTEQTASNLQEAAASLTQLTGTVRQTADAATTANQLAGSAAETAQRGGAVMGQVVATMGEISDSSRRIADIIGTIDGIAFQTNILALNAAVEAARAGEQGRGFAVVASEVRSLAQRSAEAAKEIKTLIGASVERVDAGSRLVSDAGDTMREIVSAVQRVTDIIQEISSATQEQSTSLMEVGQAVQRLDEVTQQNAALVEESSAASESLREQAGSLQHVVAQFRLHA